MASDLAYALTLLIAGLGSGFAGGLFGIGGGALRVPILLYLFAAFGVDRDFIMHMAAGTSLAVAVPGTIAACRSQYQSGNMDVPFLKSWLPALLAGVLVGLLVQRFAPGRILILVFAVVLFLQSLQLMAGRDRFHLAAQPPVGPTRWTIAAVIGALSVAIGVSGGAFTTPTLVAMSYPLRGALATATATALTASVIGAVGSVVNGLGQANLPPWSLGYVDLLAVGLMIPAVLITAPLGVRTQNRMSKDWLSRALAVFLMIVAADMAFDFFDRF